VRLEPRTVPVRLALSLLLALPGCSSEKKEPAKGGTAGGEVLEASVSDAMLPVDQVRSQAPLAPRSEADGAKHGKGDAEDAGTASSDAAGEPAGVEGATVAPPAAKPSAE
jgi:hypothetical protein